jgi:hypothetical protein
VVSENGIGTHSGQKSIRASREQIAQNQEMVRLDLDLPLPVAPEALRIEPVYAELIPAIEREGFRSLKEEMEKEWKERQRPKQGDLFG